MKTEAQRGNRQVRAVVLAAVGSCLLVSMGCTNSRSAFSGFLGDYSGLRANPDLDDALAYQSATRSLKDYDKFMIDPVIVHFAPNAKGTAIDPSKVKKLTDYAAEELRKSLSERYQVVSAPGPRVLRLRVALTDIKKTIPALNIHPATKLSGVGLGGASMEAEANDSQTGERVLAVVDTRKGNVFSVGAGLDALGHAKQVIDHWIKRFVSRVDKAHGWVDNE